MQQILLGLVTWRQQLVYYTKNPTYYEILGVSKDATQTEIKRAYYERSKELHPDRKNCSNDQEVKRRNDAFVELTTAYKVLKVPERRQSYNISLDDNKSGCTEQSSFDGLFAHCQCRNRKKQTNERNRNVLWTLAELRCLWRLFKIFSAVPGSRSSRCWNIASVFELIIIAHISCTKSSIPAIKERFLKFYNNIWKLVVRPYTESLPSYFFRKFNFEQSVIFSLLHDMFNGSISFE
uniref:J domain-containing protein n=1 Tax=Loa loa TaxID=7209 RepID=A0A1I7VL21_LOALO